MKGMLLPIFRAQQLIRLLSLNLHPLMLPLNSLFYGLAPAWLARSGCRFRDDAFWILHMSDSPEEAGCKFLGCWVDCRGLPLSFGLVWRGILGAGRAKMLHPHGIWNPLLVNKINIIATKLIWSITSQCLVQAVIPSPCYSSILPFSGSPSKRVLSPFLKSTAVS